MPTNPRCWCAHLIRLLDEADHAGLIQGEILIVPVANPIGVGQVVNDVRAAATSSRGGNFNRNWPDLSHGLASRCAAARRRRRRQRRSGAGRDGRFLEAAAADQPDVEPAAGAGAARYDADIVLDCIATMRRCRISS